MFLGDTSACSGDSKCLRFENSAPFAQIANEIVGIASDELEETEGTRGKRLGEKAS